MTTGKRIRFIALAAVATIGAACSSGSSTDLLDVNGVVQDLGTDPDGMTTVLSMEAAPTYMTVVNVQADGGQTATSVSLSGTSVTVTWDARVTPSHRVRVVGVPDVAQAWRAVSSSDASAPTFTISDAQQDTSDMELGGDTIEVTFTGPRVVETMAEEAGNWDLEVNGESMDLSDSTFAFDPATQVLDITLGESANLHSSFELAATNLTSVSDTAVDDSQVAGVASGDASAPTLTSIEQNLAEDAYGRVVDLTFSEPMDPVFAAVPGSFSLVDHADALGVTLILSVDQPTDSTMRLTFSRPVAPGLDTLSHSGLMDAHGNALGANVETLSNSTPAANSFTAVTASTVEGGADTVVVTTAQALDPDFAEDPALWSMTIGGIGVTMADQALSYDLLTQTLTVTLDSDMRNGDAVIVDAAGQYDVDGQDFTATAGSVNAAGDGSAPTFVSAVQNRTVDPLGYTLDITFSEAIHATQGEDVSNYSFSPAGTVTSASIVGAGNIVRVETSDLVMTPGDVTVTIGGAVDDLAGNSMGAPSGPNAMTSTDTAAPAPAVVAGSAQEGADDDTVIVTFNDDMVEAEVEDVTNWTFESPVGTSVDMTGSTIDYNVASRSATVTLDAGGVALKYYDDLSVAFANMRDIGGNTVDGTPLSGAIAAEKNLPSLHTVWRMDAPSDGTLELRFSEPCDNLGDLFDAGSNPYGSRFAVRDSGSALRGYPHTATIMGGGLGVRLEYGFTIALSDTVDVLGVEDLAGNVMFPSMGTAIQGEDAGAPAHFGAPTVTAVSGENNDSVVIQFSQDMSPWRVSDPSQYTIQTNPGGDVISIGAGDIAWDGGDTVTITLGGPAGDSFQAAESYDVTLNQDADNPLRSDQGVAISAPDTQTVAVTGDTVSGPTEGSCQALIDTTDPNSLIIVFDEAVNEAAVAIAGSYDYDTGNFASSVTYLSPRCVRATFDVAVAPGSSVVIAQSATDDLAGNESAADLTLAATADSTSPLLASAVGTIAAGTGGDEVVVGFSEQLDTVTALDISNYSVDNGGQVDLSGSTLTWDSVAMCVTIALPPGTDLDATQGLAVTVEDICDAAGNFMPVAVTLAGTVSGDSAAPGINSAFANYRESSLGNVIDVCFDEEVDQAFIGERINWSTDGLAGVDSVEVMGPCHVRLTLNFAMAPGDMIELASGLEDLAHNQAGGLSVAPVDPTE